MIFRTDRFTDAPRPTRGRPPASAAAAHRRGLDLQALRHRRRGGGHESPLPQEARVPSSTGDLGTQHRRLACVGDSPLGQATRTRTHDQGLGAPASPRNPSRFPACRAGPGPAGQLIKIYKLFNFRNAIRQARRDSMNLSAHNQSQAKRISRYLYFLIQRRRSVGSDSENP